MCSKLWTASHEPLLPWTLHTAHLFELALTRSSAALQGKTCKKSSGPHYRHCYNYFLYLTVQNEAKWASRNHRWDTCYTGTAPILHIISMAVITVSFIPRKVLWSSFADLPTTRLPTRRTNETQPWSMNGYTSYQWNLFPFFIDFNIFFEFQKKSAAATVRQFNLDISLQYLPEKLPPMSVERLFFSMWFLWWSVWPQQFREFVSEFVELV